MIKKLNVSSARHRILESMEVEHNTASFFPLKGWEKGNSLQLRYQCVTVLREYQCWSLEELRLQDYSSGKHLRHPCCISGIIAFPLTRVQNSLFGRQTLRPQRLESEESGDSVASIGEIQHINPFLRKNSDNWGTNPTFGNPVGTACGFDPVQGQDCQVKQNSETLSGVFHVNEEFDDFVEVVPADIVYRNTRLMSISGDRNFSDRSFEELRLEDMEGHTESKNITLKRGLDILLDNVCHMMVKMQNSASLVENIQSNMEELEFNQSKLKSTMFKEDEQKEKEKESRRDSVLQTNNNDILYPLEKKIPSTTSTETNTLMSCTSSLQIAGSHNILSVNGLTYSKINKKSTYCKKKTFNLSTKDLSLKSVSPSISNEVKPVPLSSSISNEVNPVALRTPAGAHPAGSSATNDVTQRSLFVMTESSSVTSPTGSLLNCLVTPSTRGPLCSSVTSSTGGPLSSPVTSSTGGPLCSLDTSSTGGPLSSPVTSSIGGPLCSLDTSSTGGPLSSPVTSSTGGPLCSLDTSSTGGPLSSPVTSFTGGPFCSSVTSSTGGSLSSPVSSSTGGRLSSPVTSSTGGSLSSPITSYTGGPIRSPLRSSSLGIFSSPVTFLSGRPLSYPVTSSAGGLFGSLVSSSTAGPVNSPVTSSTVGLFGSLVTSSTAGPVNSPVTSSTGGLFGSLVTSSTAGPVNSPVTSSTGGLFGSLVTSSTAGPVNSPVTSSTGGLFGSPVTSSTAGPVNSPVTFSTQGLFDSSVTSSTGGPLSSAVTSFEL
ncbi:hypothetical protein RRG08_022952 [Elysia crispata]|uniref:Uncharacterized protein n=1 Tax=Elysia crispata TaxID=231223 RepID=A0AAE1DX80_9GAST|nr:hypothetical protein RRG08_022952 [Elysia crispata]